MLVQTYNKPQVRTVGLIKCFFLLEKIHQTKFPQIWVFRFQSEKSFTCFLFSCETVFYFFILETTLDSDQQY